MCKFGNTCCDANKIFSISMNTKTNGIGYDIARKSLNQSFLFYKPRCSPHRNIRFNSFEMMIQIHRGINIIIKRKLNGNE